jgi:hypothetical protein
MPDLAATIGWVLNGVCAGLGGLLGPELAEGLKVIVTKLHGKESTTVS